MTVVVLFARKHQGRTARMRTDAEVSYPTLKI